MGVVVRIARLEWRGKDFASVNPVKKIKAGKKPNCHGSLHAEKMLACWRADDWRVGRSKVKGESDDQWPWLMGQGMMDGG